MNRSTFDPEATIWWCIAAALAVLLLLGLAGYSLAPAQYGGEPDYSTLGFDKYKPRIDNVPAADQPGAKPNKGYDIENDATAKWFSELKRPTTPASEALHDIDPETIGCCGKGDGYPIEIVQDATLGGVEEDGTFRILDGTAKTYPDKTTRPEIPNWRNLAIHFPGYKMLQLERGNPTRTAWAFMMVYHNQIAFLYCVVPLPPSY